MRGLGEILQDPTPESRRLMEHIATHNPSGPPLCPECDRLAPAAQKAENFINRGDPTLAWQEWAWEEGNLSCLREGDDMVSVDGAETAFRAGWDASYSWQATMRRAAWRALNGPAETR